MSVKLQRVILYTKDVTKEKKEKWKSIHMNEGFVVESFQYESKREHDRTGGTYHIEDATVIDIVVRINKVEIYSKLYGSMSPSNAQPFAILFNARFEMDATDPYYLKSYDDAMVVTGHMVDIELDWERKNVSCGDDNQNQLGMRIKLLMNSITFKGSSNDLTLEV